MSLNEYSVSAGSCDVPTMLQMCALRGPAMCSAGCALLYISLFLFILARWSRQAEVMHPISSKVAMIEYVRLLLFGFHNLILQS